MVNIVQNSGTFKTHCVSYRNSYRNSYNIYNYRNVNQRRGLKFERASNYMKK